MGSGRVEDEPGAQGARGGEGPAGAGEGVGVAGAAGDDEVGADGGAAGYVGGEEGVGDHVEPGDEAVAVERVDTDRDVEVVGGLAEVGIDEPRGPDLLTRGDDVPRGRARN